MKTVPSAGEIGKVTAVEGNLAWVEITPQPACETCGAKLLCVADPSGKHIVKVNNSVRARVGQQVLVTEKSNFLLYLSVLQYGLPFSGFLAGILFINILGISFPLIPHEVSLFLGGLIGLAIGALLGHRQIIHLAKKGDTFFFITEIV
jgi:positive regulator of sigma E activity